MRTGIGVRPHIFLSFSKFINIPVPFVFPALFLSCVSIFDNMYLPFENGKSIESCCQACFITYLHWTIDFLTLLTTIT